MEFMCKGRVSMYIVDFHVDTLLKLFISKRENNDSETLYQNNGHVDIKRLLESNYTAQMFACYVNLGNAPITDSYYGDALSMIEILYEGIKDSKGKIALAKSFRDYKNNKKSGLLSAFLTIEEGGIIENSIDALDDLYEKGVRVITLTWNYENCIGFPNHDFKYQYQGLKPFGIEALEKMDELGIIVDVSHLSDGGFYDIYKHGKRPFMATHSNARSVCNVSRNLTDDMIKKLADKGGIMGINFCGDFLSPDGRSTTEGMIRHIKHIIKVGGLEVVGLGTDYDGIEGDLELKGAQDLPRLVEALEVAGFSANEIESVCFKNGERFFERYWGKD